MIDFSLSDEQRAVRDWVRTFVERELMPLENEVLRRERAGADPGLNADEVRELRALARKSDFWGVETPEEYGGMGLDPVTAAIIETDIGRTFLTFKFGGEADNILFHANEQQKRDYLLPTINGERRSCFAITEPGAGSDATAIRAPSVRV